MSAEGSVSYRRVSLHINTSTVASPEAAPPKSPLAAVPPEPPLAASGLTSDHQIA